MKIGKIELIPISGGTLYIDGGNMFGVVPKMMWSRKCEADEQNRILLDTNCLLIRTNKHLALVDTGYGSKCDERSRRNFALEEGNPLFRNLAAVGVSPDEIDVVILTHLHFDHAGGCTRLDSDGGLLPCFPRARHIVQKAEWEDATGNISELAGAYFTRDFEPLEEAGLVEIIDGDAEIVPGVSGELIGGHTRGHQILRIADGKDQAVYLADLCPYVAHMRTFWSMAYDQFPLETRRVKPRVLGDAADGHQMVLFSHDPKVKAAYIARDERYEFVVEQVVA